MTAPDAGVATPAGARARGPMAEAEFDAFVDAALQELYDKQARLQERHGMGSFARWSLDPAHERLDFFDARGQKTLQTAVVVIGRATTQGRRWTWGWADPSLPPPARQRAAPLRMLADVTGHDRFAAPTGFEVGDETVAWQLAAVAVRHLGAAGVYKAVSVGLPASTFLALLQTTAAPPAQST